MDSVFLKRRQRSLGKLGKVLGSMVVLLLGALSAASAGAAEEEPLVRELFVPFEDVQVILEAPGRRMFLTREQYEDLLAKASRPGQEPAPYPATWLLADYNATVEQDRVRITGRIQLEVAEKGLQAIPIQIGEIGLLSATVDGRAAAIGRPYKDGPWMLLVDATGIHEVVLEMIAPLQVSAAQQSFR